MNKLEELLGLTATAISVIGLAGVVLSYLIVNPLLATISLGYASAGLAIAVALALHRVLAKLGVESTLPNHD